MHQYMIDMIKQRKAVANAVAYHDRVLFMDHVDHVTALEVHPGSPLQHFSPGEEHSLA